MAAEVGLRTDAMRRLRLRSDQGLGWEVVRRGAAVIVEDYHRLPLKDPPVEAVQQEGLASQIAVPLRSGVGLLGVLYIGNRRPSRFHPEDAELLMAFAEQATIAIQNARLYQDKDEFVSLVSHELRTPLTSIKGAARTLLRRYDSLEDATRRELLRDVDEESDRLHRLVENLLDFSRAEAGVLRLATEPVHLGKLAAGVVSELRSRAPTHGFDLSFPPELPPVEADPVRVEQVLRNLLDNAVKYSEAGGLIQLRARVSRDMLEVSVRDQGIGIRPEDLNRVFGRFQRADYDPQARRRQGVGLGLAICRRLVEAHGGRIWVESQPGVGSTFFFTLPIVHEEWG